ncbi:ATP-binding protein [Lichenibacterium dinghuense]|uniref:ATP-binding protein n=1 Tax=Lichenibacterium dinghuense TaxID=2895977 RepID=UPI002815EAF0|nr:ATP-binding protein [Lichenibacterium sp. 6Y81]
MPEGGLLYCVARDVTDQRAREAELAEVEGALRQAQKMEAVGQLTGGIAHDFNNLLTGIIGSLDLMQTRIDQGRTDTVSRYARAASASASRAAALTHRLLAFARRQPLDVAVVDADALVASLDELLRRTIGEAIRLEIVRADGLWRTLCDPHQLENAVLNLCINARDAMPGGGRITIQTANVCLDNAYARHHPEVTPGQFVRVSVTDTGTGMPPEVVAKAFEPFFTTKPAGRGTGLGLSMIYGFAKQSKGHAKIISEAGRGTTIELYLPRTQNEAGADVTEGASSSRRAESGETVLIVEDDPVVRDLVVEVLGDLGYRMLVAEDGPSGLQILRSGQRVDLLVSDVGLPDLDGRQMVERARAQRPTLKVLFITGYAENANFGVGARDPGTQLMTKPFAVDTLARRVREMIGP